MSKNKRVPILLLLGVLLEEIVVDLVHQEAAEPEVAAVVVPVEYHHTLIHVPIEQQVADKVSDNTYTLCTLLYCSLYECTSCMLDIHLSLLSFLLHYPSKKE
jgi:hypothetical protein